MSGRASALSAGRRGADKCLTAAGSRRSVARLAADAGRKAEANLRTHGVSFAEAVTVLEDDFAMTREDPDTEEEPRFVTLGLSDLGNLLVVVYMYREPDVIRLISAWKANKRQGELYEKDRS